MCNRIRRLRIERKLSQEQLAQKIGITQQMQSKIETNQKILDSELINSYCDFFNVSSDYLLNRSDYRYITEESIMVKDLITKNYELFSKIRKLTVSEKNFLFDMLNIVEDYEIDYKSK